MARHRRPTADARPAAPRPYWSQVLRALRETRGITQDGWAVQLGYGRATVKRWEAGEAVPSADAEATILGLCREKGLFRRFAEGPLTGVHVTPEWLADLLAAARLGSGRGQSPAPPARATPPAGIRYALSGEVAIAYQIFGSGPPDLVVTPGAVSHREVDWEHPGAMRFFDRLASFARVLIFDKRGTGMSDRVVAGTLEERMDDIRAVMDAAGVRRAALFGISDGGPMSILFAATYPERMRALVLYGSFASEAPSIHHRVSAPPDQLQRQIDHLRRTWGTPDSGFLDVVGPSVADDPGQREWWARFLRISASPGAVIALRRMNAEIDVRHVLPTIRVPTLVLHRAGDRLVDLGHARYMAEHIPGARLVELPGVDHLPWLGDVDGITDAVVEFLTETSHVVEADSVLATVLFTDIVRPRQRGDDAGLRGRLETHQALVRRELARHRGREISTAGDGFLATFDGPTRAVRCACGIRDAARSLGLEARTGVHTGEVELRGDGVAGVAVDISARVAALAGPGEVLVSGTVTDLVAGSGLQFAERGTCPLEGATNQWRLFTVQAEDERR